MNDTEKQKNRILIVDDESSVLDVFLINFSERYEIFTASSGQEALDIFQQHEDIGVILSDYRMPGMTGVKLLRKIYELAPDTIRILITAYADFDNIYDAINEGHIYQYIRKPWKSADLNIVLEQGVNSWNLIKENKRLAQEQQRMNEELQRLTVKIIHTQENERKRISMELHDDIGQNLIALKLQFSNFYSQLQGGDIEHLEETEEIISKTLQQTIENTRTICHDLSPVVIEEFGFDHALKDIVDHFSRDYQIKTEMQDVKVQDFFSKQDQHQIYRIVQEVFNNIGKHSGTDRISITTENQNHVLKMIISDYGCGFDVEKAFGNEAEAADSVGFGLHTIRERATILGGTIEITSIKDNGSNFTLTLPHTSARS